MTGAGRVRHFGVRELWVQERIRRGELSMIKVPGEDNVADGLTKLVKRSKMVMCVEKRGFARREGRHELCPYLGGVRVHHQVQRVQWVGSTFIFSLAAMSRA
jgi:hypothetical protein